MIKINVLVFNVKIHYAFYTIICKQQEYHKSLLVKYINLTNFK